MGNDGTQFQTRVPPNRGKPQQCSRTAVLLTPDYHGARLGTIKTRAQWGLLSARRRRSGT